MSNLTLARFVRPIDSWNRGVTSENIFPTRKHFRKYCFPATGGESEGHSPEAWSRGWPLVTAKRAPSTSRGGLERGSERGSERIAMHGSDPFSENQTPTTTWARSSGALSCPLTTSSPHWSSNVTSKRVRSLFRPLCKVRTWVGR
jgi:hypothetical protein